TIMIKFNALDLIPTAVAIRATVLVNRDACKTDFARSLHETLAGKLDRVCTDLHEEAAAEQRLAAEKGTVDGDEWYDLYHTWTSFERRWIDNGPFSVLDQTYEDVVCDGTICRAGLDYTIVPAKELEGLGEILDTIRRDIGIVFIVARV
ncbi:hypothetical protein, partial [Paramesorhizobium deserti]|uniref:hypothetical protein n=1 Tax=Paramesorhizobium deserti TaxID=1494590 RepID=UPI001AECE0E1